MKKIFIIILLLNVFISKEIEYQDEIKKIEDEIILNQLIDINYNDTMKLNIQEKIFRDYPILPFIILIFGLFLTLYGVSYNFFLIIEITIFLYYTITIFFKGDDSNLNRNLLLVLLFSFISGVLLFLGHKMILEKKVTKNKEIIKKFGYGLITGAFCNQIIFHFVLEFNNDFDDSNTYYILYPIITLLLGAINIFYPINIAFIPCSIISGFFFIKLSIDSFYSSLLLSKGEKILDIIYLVVILAFAFFFQLYHIRRKENEVPGFIDKITYKKNADISMQDMTPQTPNETKEMIEKDEKNLDVTGEVDNNQIDDQDD